MRLEGKVAIVTGAASGFGEGIARRFGEEGAHVVLADSREEPARVVAEEIVRAEGSALSAQVDVTQPDSVSAMVDLAVRRFGRLDVLINNAGIGQRPVPLEETPDDVLNTLWRVNVLGVFYGCRYAVPVLRRQGRGVILNAASTIALQPKAGMVAYAASKAAVVALTKGLAVELAGDRIRVNALVPAAGDTPMLREFMGGEETPEGRQKFLSSIPMGRLVAPADLGAAAAWLASDEAEMITGTCFAVDGGRLL